jgi:hypothetical protein
VFRALEREYANCYNTTNSYNMVTYLSAYLFEIALLLKGRALISDGSMWWGFQACLAVVT